MCVCVCVCECTCVCACVCVQQCGNMHLHSPGLTLSFNAVGNMGKQYRYWMCDATCLEPGPFKNYLVERVMERKNCMSGDVLINDLAVELRTIEKEALKATMALVMKPKRLRPKKLPPVPKFDDAGQVHATASCQGFP